MNWSIVLRQTGKSWSIFGVIEGKPDTLLEGGFFDKEFAEQCRAEWEADALAEEARQAERKAGWDAKP